MHDSTQKLHVNLKDYIYNTIEQVFYEIKLLQLQDGGGFRRKLKINKQKAKYIHVTLYNPKKNKK